MDKIYPDSKVEIDGKVAQYYEQLLNIVTFGRYRVLINDVIRRMEIKNDEQIIDLGAGTGYNACFMAKYLSDKGKVLGLDIGDTMIARFKEKCKNYPELEIKKMRIDKSLPFEEEFDKAFISFVIHGLPHSSRKKVIHNVMQVLKTGGIFYILDYGEFDYKELPFYLRIPFEKIECKYAFDYIKRPWKKILKDSGFEEIEAINYYNGFVRLLMARK